MSLRGVKFQFECGEPVICFEPDSTKARVLYNAKILDLIVGRSNDGTRQAEYLVHFQGWNSSWDRVVPESFILGNTEENKDLMKLIASAARKIKTNRQRKRKIEILLKKHFRGHPEFVENCSDDTETDENIATETELDTDDNNNSDTEGSDDEISFKDRTIINGIPEDDDEEQEKIQEVDVVPHSVELELPENLKRKLEDDCYFICRKDKLVQLPASPSVISVLEGYVKNFTANLMYSTTEKKLPRRERRSKPLPQKNIELVKEVVDGLRTFFDFTLPTILLYNDEKEQYKQVINNYIHTSEEDEFTTKYIVSEEKAAEVEVYSPRLRSSASKSTSQTQPPCSSPTITSTCSSPRAQRNSPRATGYSKHDISEENILEEFSDSPPRRMTRNIFSDFTRKRGISDSKGDMEGISSKEKTPKMEANKHSMVDLGEEASSHDTRKESLRSGGRNCEGELSVSGTRRRKSGGCDSKGNTLIDRVVPPPPLNMTAHISSKDSTTSSQNTPSQPSDSSSSMVYCNGYKTKEAALNHIYGWNLIPQAVYETCPTPPSVVYGAHHLLRLFVKLPQLLSKMAIPANNVENLVDHLEMFIDYMSERSEELFPDTVYNQMK